MYFEAIKRYYSLGYYDKSDLKLFVESGAEWLTPEQYEEITGEAYTV